MLDGGVIEPWKLPHGDSARVLLLSMRNLTRHVSRCAGYEFEDVIAECDHADIIAPARTPQRSGGALRRCVGKVMRLFDPLIKDEIRLSSDYDLFVVFVRSEKDLRYVDRIKGWRDRCRISVCVLDELRTQPVKRSPRSVEVLSRFDRIFSSIEDSVDTIQQVTRRPCHFIPGGVDALKFCPYPRNPPRSIDVYSMGRRPAAVHQALMARGVSDDAFYFYDTTSDFAVIEPWEHRLLLANLIKRTRYFIAFPPKFDRPAEAPGERDLGLRFFEGAAGGAVMLGLPPNGTAFSECFDWRDAVIRTTADGRGIAALMAELDGQPERLAHIRRDNVSHSLCRHDWIHRWRRMLETIGLPVSSGVVKREECLRNLAELVAANGFK
jgi:hypothetical protein